ncbi:MAG: CpaD family pilus assembly protein [Pseudomonadota bacterium]|nr:CpaD family pilus assembly protein [Pseudomonadota bacterium]
MNMISASRLLAMAAAAAIAAGCSSVTNGREQALSVAEQHPISVDTQVVTLTIDLDPTVSDLTAIDKARIRAFADSYLVSGHGPLTVTAPSGAGTDLDGQETASDIRRYLNELGVEWSQITGATYRAGSEKRQLIMSYTHYVATPSACGDWSGDTMSRYRNLNSPNFGCATQNNLAAMVADPRDLIQPADSSPADAEGRIRVIRAYRTGEPTASATADIDTKASQQ